MSGREPAAFASLYYTDCLPGQGLGGGAGFGFQARSEGAGEDEQRLVQRGALYEVPVRWMRDRRPVADFPPSLAHLHDGAGTERTYVTAGGRYLGREANGYRDGNQFTHAVVTREAGSYGLVRPAQLWGASWWASAPAPTTSCAPVPPHPDPGPWDTETVRERIAAVPDGRERLLALVTALGGLQAGADRRRVLLVTDRGDDAACWLAAATLLLDRERALAISFKIFATDPDRSPHDVVVAHPDWAGPYRRQDGYLVLDLLEHAPPEIAPPTIVPSAEALFWVPLFLGADDPLDVVDAVEVAGQLAREGHPDGRAVPGEVEREAAALTVGLPLGVDPGAAVRIAGWLRTAGPGAVDVLGAPLVGTLVAQTHDHTALLDLDAVAAIRAAALGAAELGWDAVAAAARRRLFDREADLAADGGHVPDTPLRPVAGSLPPRTPSGRWLHSSAWRNGPTRPRPCAWPTVTRCPSRTAWPGGSWAGGPTTPTPTSTRTVGPSTPRWSRTCSASSSAGSASRTSASGPPPTSSAAGGAVLSRWPGASRCSARSGAWTSRWPGPPSPPGASPPGPRSPGWPPRWRRGRTGAGCRRGSGSWGATRSTTPPCAGSSRRARRRPTTGRSRWSPTTP